MTPAERKAYQLEWCRQERARIKADPVLRAQAAAKKNAAQNARRAAQRDEARAAAALRAPSDLNAELFRAHGPFATLFLLQQEAA